nr:HEAT repeat domain-containing protein [Bacteroidota bacterium]
MNAKRIQNIDVKHIALDLQFDWNKKQAFGTATITLSTLLATDKINLDAGMLTINSIKLADGTSLKFDYDGSDKNDALTVNLNRNYKANEELIIKIDYHTNYVNNIDPLSLSGSLGKGLRFSQPTSNDPLKPKEIYSVGDPESNRYWLPCYDAPDDLRTTEFTATVDKSLAVISNGTLVNTKINSDGTHTMYYKMNTPYSNYLTAFVISEYVDVVQNFEGVTLHNYGYAKEKDAIETTVVRLPDMMQYFSQATGVKYPYANYSQTFVQDVGTFVSNTTFSTITENMVDDYGTHADFFYLWDLTEAEALAQQWFGSYITAKDWSHAWLNKSFAHYFNCLYNEQKNGCEEFLMFQHAAYDIPSYFGDWSAGYRHPIVTQHFENTASFTGDNYATFRGSLVLHMLRKQLGDEKFWQAMQLYVKQNGNKLVTTKDFQNAVEKASGEKMDWFFQQWIYKMGHPVFEVTQNYDETKKQITINIKQTQTIDTKNEYPQSDYFKGKMIIEIDGRLEQITIQAKPENIYTFDNQTKPGFINFNFENTWICETTFEKTFDELINQLQNSKDILARQSAVVALADIAKDEKTTEENKNKIKIEFRKVVMSDAYWRLRAAAIFQLRALTASGIFKMDDETISMLLAGIKKDESWTRAALINFLGTTKDEKYVDIYLNALNDKSDRVINTAAIALGKTKSAKAFDALSKLVDKPSMKSQSLLCALSGLKELGDPRGYDIAYKALSDLTLPRWRLPDFSIWDYRVFAVQLIASLGKSHDAFPVVFERFKKSMNENDVEGIFNNVILIINLADPRGKEAFELLKTKFKNDTKLISAINNYEAQFMEAIKK